MDPLYVFIFSGTFSMSGAIFASTLLKLPEEQRPGWATSRQGQVALLMLGNLFAAVLVGAMVYGVMNLTWWIPVVCLFLSFPILHVVILDRVLGAKLGVWVSGLGALAGLAALIHYW